MLSQQQRRTMLVLDGLNFLLAAVNLRTAVRQYHASLAAAQAPQHGCQHSHCQRQHRLHHFMRLHLQAHCRHHRFKQQHCHH